MKNCSCACSHSSSTTEKKEAKEVPEHQPHISYTVLDDQKVTQIVAKINLRDDPPTDWSTILYFIIGTIGFYLMSGPITYLFSMEIWPSTDTGSQDF